METKIVKLSEIKPAPYNPRVELTAKDQEYKALDASIEEHGLVLPLMRWMSRSMFPLLRATL